MYEKRIKGGYEMNEKKLGLSSAIAAGIGLIVATSCLITLSQGVGIAGKGFIIAMTIACFLNILVAFSFAEMNALMPISGGLGQYTMAAMGPVVSMVAVIGGYLFTMIFAGSSEAVMLGFVISSSVMPGINPLVIAMVAMVILLVINLFGIKSYARTQIIVTAFMIGSLLVFSVVGYLKIGSGEVISQAGLPFNPMGSDIVTMTALAFWLFIGVEFVTPLTKDMKNAKRNIPLGMIISLLVLLVIQSLMVLAVNNYVSADVLLSSNQPHMEFARLMMGNLGTGWMMIISVGAVISTMNTIFASIPRMLEGLAESGMLPAFFAKKNKYGVPYISLLTLFGLITGATLSGISSADDVVTLILTGSVFWMIAYVIAHINVLLLRKKYPESKPSFQVKLFGLPQIIGIAGMIYMVANIIDVPEMKLQIYKTTIVMMSILIIYSVVWVKKVMKTGLFTTISIEQVIADSESELVEMELKEGLELD